MTRDTEISYKTTNNSHSFSEHQKQQFCAAFKMWKINLKI